MRRRDTIVYKNGGDYVGRYGIKTVDAWKAFGKRLGQKYMFKGFRPNFGGQSDSIVVFDNENWSVKEIARRKENGFLGIRNYYIR